MQSKNSRTKGVMDIYCYNEAVSMIYLRMYSHARSQPWRNAASCEKVITAKRNVAHPNRHPSWSLIKCHEKACTPTLIGLVSNYTCWPVLELLYTLKDRPSDGVSAKASSWTFWWIKIFKDNLEQSFEKANDTPWLATGHRSEQSKGLEKRPRNEGATLKLSHSGWQTVGKVGWSKTGRPRLSMPSETLFVFCQIFEYTK